MRLRCNCAPRRRCRSGARSPAAQDIGEIHAVPDAVAIHIAGACWQGPAIHIAGSEVSDAYKDVVARFLGEERPLRFADYEKPGILSRIFGGK